MSQQKHHSSTKMVPVPTNSIVPERDINDIPVLETRHLGIEFGGLKAVDDFNLTIGKTEIAGLIGPNGAGKTTVFNLITKVYEPTSGATLINGRDLHGLGIAQASKLGIARTFQNIRLFDNMTVEENVRIGLHNNIKYDMFSGIMRLPRYWIQENRQHEKALELLHIFGMENLADERAGSLPYGVQRRLEIVRALATNPRDQFQIAILLIEHDMNLVMGVCEGICVLNFGRVFADAAATEIQQNPVVIEAYLGKKKEGQA